MLTALTTDPVVEQMSYLNDSIKEIHRELRNIRTSIDSKPTPDPEPMTPKP